MVKISKKSVLKLSIITAQVFKMYCKQSGKSQMGLES